MKKFLEGRKEIKKKIKEKGIHRNIIFHLTGGKQGVFLFFNNNIEIG